MKTVILLGFVSVLTACGPFQGPLEVNEPEISAEADSHPTATPEIGVPEGRAAVFPTTIVVYREEGPSEAGLRQWTFYHTGRILPSDGKSKELHVGRESVSAFFETVESDGFWSLEESYGTPDDCPECPVRILTVYLEGQIMEITVAGQPASIPEVLAHALGELKLLLPWLAQIEWG